MTIRDGEVKKREAVPAAQAVSVALISASAFRALRLVAACERAQPLP